MIAVLKFLPFFTTMLGGFVALPYQPVEDQDDMQAVELETSLDRVRDSKVDVEHRLPGLGDAGRIQPASGLGCRTLAEKSHLGLDFAASRSYRGIAVRGGGR